MRNAVRALIVAAALLPAGCTLPGPGHTPYGRLTTVYPDRGPGVRGELLAASDTIWVASGGSLVGHAADRLQQVNIQRHRFGAQRSFVALSIGGAATGLGMAVACMSYNASEEGGGDGGECGLLVPAFSAAFLVIGSVFALINYVSAEHTLDPRDPRLPSFSRYPQGLPDTVRKLQVIPQPMPRANFRP